MPPLSFQQFPLSRGTISFAVDDSQPILNVPYSVFEETEHNWTLGDGTHMVTRSQTRLYRDSNGRTRKERFANRFGTPSNEPTIIEIHDPVAGAAYTLFVGERVARRVAPPAKFPTNPNAVRKPPSPAERVQPKPPQKILTPSQLKEFWLTACGTLRFILKASWETTGRFKSFPKRGSRRNWVCAA